MSTLSFLYYLFIWSARQQSHPLEKSFGKSQQLHLSVKNSNITAVPSSHYWQEIREGLFFSVTLCQPYG